MPEVQKLGFGIISKFLAMIYLLGFLAWVSYQLWSLLEFVGTDLRFLLA